MAKKAAPRHVEPEDESQDIEEREAIEAQEPDDASMTGGKAMSKAEAIRRVMADGIDNPSLGSQEIKKRFGIDVTPQHFSASKAQMKSREPSKKGKPGRKPKAAPSQSVEGYLAPPPKQPTAGDAPDLIEAMEAMKPLIASLGKDQVHRIVDLLG